MISCGSSEDRRQECPLAHDVAKQAVRETFAILGVDVNSPREVEEFRKSLRFGDVLRKAADKGMVALVLALIGGLVAALWAGIKLKVGQ